MRLKGGSVVQMAKLAIGDSVEVAPGQYSPVFMFTHRLDTVWSEFVSIRARVGAKLLLSPGHFVYINGKLAPAADARVGHSVEVGGAPCEIVAVDRVVRGDCTIRRLCMAMLSSIASESRRIQRRSNSAARKPRSPRFGRSMPGSVSHSTASTAEFEIHFYFALYRS